MTTRRGRARQVGVSEAMLRRHEAAGTIAPEADGSWDVSTIRARLKEAQDPAREAFEAVGQPRTSRGVKAPGAYMPPLPKPGDMKTIIPAMTFNEARAVNENLKAARLKIELAELEGRLIDRHKAVELVQELAQGERDAILAWPSRAAPILAAELGVDQHALHAALDASLREHLTARSEITLEV